MNATQTKSPLQGHTAVFAAWLLLAAVGSGFSTTHYVDQNSTNPAPPYATWATAARVIQDVVDVAAAGDEVVVTNGFYATGGRPVGADLQTNRVAAEKPLTLRSVNGPSVTTISGYPDANVRCVSLTDGDLLSGFTLTQGTADFGGGVFCATTNAVVTNCVLVSNEAGYGGGACGGTLNNCTLIGNVVSIGVEYGGWTYDFSGVVYFGDTVSGGGASDCWLNNCTLIGNIVENDAFVPVNLEVAQWFNLSYFIGGAYGGGAANSTLNNCTLISNSADCYVVAYAGFISWYSHTGHGGGAYSCNLNNCIVYGNSAPFMPEYGNGCSLNYCCTTPMPANGFGNITNAPLFVDPAGENLRPQTNSPCINAGNNDYVATTTDLDGNPRISGGTVDIGAYEFQNPASITFRAWLQQFGLPTDGSADHSDSDGDGMDNWQEWRCGTDPTNPLSVLRMVLALPTGMNVMVTWQSVAGVNYFLERGTSLATPETFAPIATTIPGQPATTSYTDTNAVDPGPFFYRVGVGN